ncbi:MAG: IS200/IS605 family transposase [Thermoguttaceae bacterium]
MANTYSQIYIHAVFAVYRRGAFIPAEHEVEIHKYIGGIIRERQMKLLALGGMSDHVHLLFALNPSVSISDIMRDVKAGTSKLINDKKMVAGRFQWQTGYGAFSCSHSQVESVYRYILGQKEHHRTKTFREEYIEFLEKFNVPYDEKYVFD